jgi:ribosomal protein S18 acetylase RimI-like enzyme
MPPVRIKTLTRISGGDLVRLVSGYVTRERYVVKKSDRRDRITILLVRTRMRAPFVKEFPRPSADLQHYREVVRRGSFLGAYDDTTLVGLALAEPLAWNRSLWVWEIGVARSHRRRGIGRRLVDELSRRARKAGLRVLVCETQTTNVPAIDFYRKVGFGLDGVDVSYYTNEDLGRGEIAVFMKKHIRGTRTSGDPRRRRRHRSTE